MLGWRQEEDLYEDLRNCFAVVVPSIWYDNIPNAILEAFSLGKPVIGSLLGSIPELVTDWETGWLFEPSNYKDLAEKILWMRNHPEQCEMMGRKARALVESEYTPQKHYERLMALLSYLTCHKS